MLEDVGILKNIKRFAGASVGSMVASLAAIGVSPTELEEFLGQDVRKILAGKVSILSALFWWHFWTSFVEFVFHLPVSVLRPDPKNSFSILENILSTSRFNMNKRFSSFLSKKAQIYWAFSG